MVKVNLIQGVTTPPRNRTSLSLSPTKICRPTFLSVSPSLPAWPNINVKLIFFRFRTYTEVFFFSSLLQKYVDKFFFLSHPPRDLQPYQDGLLYIILINQRKEGKGIGRKRQEKRLKRKKIMKRKQRERQREREM